jgi:hypothetical protein
LLAPAVCMRTANPPQISVGELSARQRYGARARICSSSPVVTEQRKFFTFVRRFAAISLIFVIAHAFGQFRLHDPDRRGVRYSRAVLFHMRAEPQPLLASRFLRLRCPLLTIYQPPQKEALYDALYPATVGRVEQVNGN